MVRANTDGLLGANLPKEYVENFWKKAAPEGTAKTLVIKAMARFWLDLTDESRRSYLYPIKDDKKLSEVIGDIVNKKIQTAFTALAKNISPDIPEQEFQQKILKALKAAQEIPAEKQSGKKAKTSIAG
jgi:hypothetical protein